VLSKERSCTCTKETCAVIRENGVSRKTNITRACLERKQTHVVAIALLSLHPSSKEHAQARITG
jgi:hypothetical protein